MNKNTFSPSEEGSLSSTIRNKMESKGVTPEKLAKQTMISDHFIEMVIEGSFDNLPPRPYVHGYILKIAEALGLDGKKLWEQHLKDVDGLRSSGEKDKLPENRFLVAGLNIKVVAGIVLGVLIVVYFVWQIFFAFNIGKVFHVEGFNDGPVVTTNESVFVVRGNIKPGLGILINDEETLIGPDGEFEKNIFLRPGLNNIVFTVSKAFGKKDSITKQVYYNPQEAESEDGAEALLEPGEEGDIINTETN